MVHWRFPTKWMVVLCLHGSVAFATEPGVDCARDYTKLGLAQKKFEEYRGRLPELRQDTAYLVADSDARFWEPRLIREFRNKGRVDPEALRTFTRGVAKRLNFYGFKAEVDPLASDRILVHSLPEGHPLTQMFRRTQKPPLGVHYVFEVQEFLKGEAAGHQADRSIFIADLFSGKFNKMTVLHEVGHRSSQVRSRTEQRSLYNCRVSVSDKNEASKFVKLGPGIYDGEMNSDELIQHEKDLRRLYAKGAEDLVASGGDKVDLESLRRSKKALLRGIAESALSQSEFTLRYTDDPSARLFWELGRESGQAGKNRVSVPVGPKKPFDGHAAWLEYDLTASQLVRHERNFQLKPDGKSFVEVRDPVRIERPQEPLSAQEYSMEEIRAIRSDEETVNQKRLREIVRSLVEHQRSEAQRVLRDLDALEEP